MKPIWV